MTKTSAVNLQAYLTAWRLAEGDEERIEILSPTEIMVWNQPRRLRKLPRQDKAGGQS